MPTITITLIDPDFDFSLPARWGTDYQVTEIQLVHRKISVYLNGDLALILTLSPLKNPYLSEFSQGCCPISRDVRLESYQPTSPYCWYYYIDVLKCTLPLAVGSSFGSLYRVSEVKQVEKKQWTLNNDQWQYEWCPCWRYTLAPRRDPILLLPSVPDKRE